MKSLIKSRMTVDVAQLHHEETLEEIAKITMIEMAKKKEKDCFMAKIMEIKRTK